MIFSKEDEVKLNCLRQNESISSENQRNDEGLNKGARKTEFEEFLKLEVSKTSLSAEEDLELERKLQRNSR